MYSVIGVENRVTNESKYGLGEREIVAGSYCKIIKCNMHSAREKKKKKKKRGIWSHTVKIPHLP